MSTIKYLTNVISRKADYEVVELQLGVQASPFSPSGLGSQCRKEVSKGKGKLPVCSARCTL